MHSIALSLSGFAFVAVFCIAQLDSLVWHKHVAKASCQYLA